MNSISEYETAVTMCPPGKRALRRPPPTGERVLVAPVLPERLTDLQKDRLREDMLSVVKSQPHRAGSDDKMLVDPLGRFCRKSWPPRSVGREDFNADHRGVMYASGQRFAEIVHQHRVAIGLGSGSMTKAEGFSVDMTDEQRAAQCEAARIKREDAEAVLRAVDAKAVAAMTRIAVDELDPTPYQEDLIKHCLWALAVNFGFVKPGVRAY